MPAGRGETVPRTCEDVLVAHLAGDGVGFGRGLGVEDDLDEAAGVAQVDEDERPWSRRRCTQPASSTSWPLSVFRRSPQ